MAISLSSISRTKRARAPKILVVGQGKIGKTTFAAMAPNAIGILTEDGWVVHREMARSKDPMVGAVEG